MNSKLDIDKLIEKFYNNSISHDELELLYSFMNLPETEGERDAYLRHLWDTKCLNEKMPESSNSWDKLETVVKNTAKSGKRIIYFNQFAKYAAVIIITFLTTWFIFTLFNPSTSTKEVFAEYTVPLGSKSFLKLPDGSKVWLNSGSKLIYNNDFSKSNRTIRLEGEAYFDVAHNTKIPFIVNTFDLSIRVHGTKFNVKSFSDEKIIETTLVKGSITIEKIHPNGNVIQTISMVPNQMVEYFKNNGKFVVIDDNENKTVTNISDKKENEALENLQPIIPLRIEIATAWKDNRLTFKGENIETLINKLQRWYGVEITLKNERLNKAMFTGSFDKETIEQALYALQITIPFKYKMEKNKITIY